MSEWTLVGLKVVQAVAAHGTFTGAADALGYTQSAISRQVAAMERATGGPLFSRRPRGVEPTPEGRVVIRHAAAVLDRIDAASLELAGRRDHLEGRLAVGALPATLGVLVPRAIARMRGDHPALEIVLREGGSPRHLRHLRAGRIAVAILAVGDGLETPDLDGLRADLVLEGGLMLAVGEQHRLAGRRRVDVSELEVERWIVTGGDGPRFDAWPGLSEPRTAYAVREWPARIGMVAAGLGVAVVPEILAGAMPHGVQLLTVNEPQPVRRSVLAVTSRERTPAAEAFVGALRNAGAELVDPALFAG